MRAPIMAPRKAKMIRVGQPLAMTARGNATHHEQAAAMASRCPVTAKKVIAPTEVVMVSHPEGLVPSKWQRNPAIAAQTLGLTSSLDHGYLQLTRKSKQQLMACDRALIASIHNVSSARKR